MSSIRFYTTRPPLYVGLSHADVKRLFEDYVGAVNEIFPEYRAETVLMINTENGEIVEVPYPEESDFVTARAVFNP
jgi:hypothetical protein